jgi:hypothetical protein
MRIDSGSQISYTIEYNITTVPCNVIGKEESSKRGLGKFLVLTSKQVKYQGATSSSQLN